MKTTNYDAKCFILCKELRAALSLFRRYGDYRDSAQPPKLCIIFTKTQQWNTLWAIRMHFRTSYSVSQAQTLPDSPHRYVPDGTARVEFYEIWIWLHTHGHLCMYTQWSLAEIQTTTHRTLTGSSVTALPPALSPSSILPPTSSIALSFSQG